MKLFKRIAATLCASLFCLMAGCGQKVPAPSPSPSASADGDAPVYFTEAPMPTTPSGEILRILGEVENGYVVEFLATTDSGFGEVHIGTVDDGLGGFQSRLSQDLGVVTSSLDKQGQLYVIDFMKTLHIFDKQFAPVKQIDLSAISELREEFVNMPPIVVDNQLWLMTHDGYVLLGQDGKVAASGKLPIDGDRLGVVTDGHDLYVASGNSQRRSLKKVKAVDASVEWETEIAAKDSYKTMTFDATNKQILVLSGDSILTYGVDGSEQGQLLDFTDRDLYRTERTKAQEDAVAVFNQLYISPTSDLMITASFYAEDSFELHGWRYTRIEGDEARQLMAAEQAKTNAKTKLSVLLPYPNYTADYVAQLMEANHPDVDVVFTYISETSDIAPEDCTQRVNTLVLTEKASFDVMFTQLLPYTTYIKKGVLTNIDQLKGTSALSDDSRFYTNMIDACRQDGALYFLPIRASFETLCVPKTADIAREVMEKQGKLTWRELIDLLGTGNQRRLITRWNPFVDDVRLYYPRPYYEYLRRILQGENLDDQLKEALEIAHLMSRDELYTPTVEDGVFTFLFSADVSNGMGLFDYLKSHHITNAPSVESSANGFYLQESLAIMASSTQKELALAFICCYMENMNADDSISRNDATQLKRNLTSSMTDGSYQTLDAPIRQTISEKGDQLVVTAEDLAERDRIVAEHTAAKEALNTAYIGDNSLYASIEQVVDSYCGGGMSVDAAVSAIKDKIWFYANE